MPASQEWLAVFSNALSQTIYAHNYEQIDDAALTPEQAAEEAYARYVAWLTATCGSPNCGLQPNGSKVYRVSPTTGHYEYLQDEEWVQDEDIPPTPARTEPTEPDRKCAAASNAVEVLRLTWVEAMAQYDANVAALDAQVDTALAISALVGAVFYPPIIAMAGLTQLGWEIVYNTYEALTFADWDEAFTRNMVCLFLAHADDTGDVVTFDYAAILRDLWKQAFTLQTYLVMAGQVEWLLSWIGPDAMNAAGALEIVEGDCDSCGTWCYEFLPAELMTVDNGHFDTNGYLIGSAYAGWGGYYGSCHMSVDTSDCVITRIGGWLSGSYPGSVTIAGGATPGTGDIGAGTWVNRTYTGGIETLVMSPDDSGAGTTSDTTSLSFYIDRGGSEQPALVRVRVEGTGTNPFGAGSNC